MTSLKPQSAKSGPDSGAGATDKSSPDAGSDKFSHCKCDCECEKHGPDGEDRKQNAETRSGEISGTNAGAGAVLQPGTQTQLTGVLDAGLAGLAGLGIQYPTRLDERTIHAIGEEPIRPGQRMLGQQQVGLVGTTADQVLVRSEEEEQDFGELRHFGPPETLNSDGGAAEHHWAGWEGGPGGNLFMMSPASLLDEPGSAQRIIDPERAPTPTGPSEPLHRPESDPDARGFDDGGINEKKRAADEDQRKKDQKRGLEVAQSAKARHQEQQQQRRSEAAENVQRDMDANNPTLGMSKELHDAKQRQSQLENRIQHGQAQEINEPGPLEKGDSLHPRNTIAKQKAQFGSMTPAEQQKEAVRREADVDKSRARAKRDLELLSGTGSASASGSPATSGGQGRAQSTPSGGVQVSGGSQSTWDGTEAGRLSAAPTRLSGGGTIRTTGGPSGAPSARSDVVDLTRPASRPRWDGTSAGRLSAAPTRLTSGGAITVTPDAGQASAASPQQPPAPHRDNRPKTSSARIGGSADVLAVRGPDGRPVRSRRRGGSSGGGGFLGSEFFGRGAATQSRPGFHNPNMGVEQPGGHGHGHGVQQPGSGSGMGPAGAPTGSRPVGSGGGATYSTHGRSGHRANDFGSRIHLGEAPVSSEAAAAPKQTSGAASDGSAEGAATATLRNPIGTGWRNDANSTLAPNRAPDEEVRFGEPASGDVLKPWESPRKGLPGMGRGGEPSDFRKGVYEAAISTAFLDQAAADTASTFATLLSMSEEALAENGFAAPDPFSSAHGQLMQDLDEQMGHYATAMNAVAGGLGSHLNALKTSIAETASNPGQAARRYRSAKKQAMREATQAHWEAAVAAWREDPKGPKPKRKDSEEAIEALFKAAEEAAEAERAADQAAQEGGEAGSGGADDAPAEVDCEAYCEAKCKEECEPTDDGGPPVPSHDDDQGTMNMTAVTAPGGKFGLPETEEIVIEGQASHAFSRVGEPMPDIGSSATTSSVTNRMTFQADGAVTTGITGTTSLVGSPGPFGRDRMGAAHIYGFGRADSGVTGTTWVNPPPTALPLPGNDYEYFAPEPKTDPGDGGDGQDLEEVAEEIGKLCAEALFAELWDYLPAGLQELLSDEEMDAVWSKPSVQAVLAALIAMGTTLARLQEGMDAAKGLGDQRAVDALALTIRAATVRYDAYWLLALSTIGDRAGATFAELDTTDPARFEAGEDRYEEAALELQRNIAWLALSIVRETAEIDAEMYDARKLLREEEAAGEMVVEPEFRNQLAGDLMRIPGFSGLVMNGLEAASAAGVSIGAEHLETFSQIAVDIGEEWRAGGTLGATAEVAEAVFEFKWLDSIGTNIGQWTGAWSDDWRNWSGIAAATEDALRAGFGGKLRRQRREQERKFRLDQLRDNWWGYVGSRALRAGFEAASVLLTFGVGGAAVQIGKEVVKNTAKQSVFKLLGRLFASGAIGGLAGAGAGVNRRVMEGKPFSSEEMWADVITGTVAGTLFGVLGNTWGAAGGRQFVSRIAASASQRAGAAIGRLADFVTRAGAGVKTGADRFLARAVKRAGPQLARARQLLERGRATLTDRASDSRLGRLQRDYRAWQLNRFRRNSTRFYSVLDDSDAARLARGGSPWPTGETKASLGEGFYTWGTRAQAEKYLERMADFRELDPTRGIRVRSFRIKTKDLRQLSRLDLTQVSENQFQRFIDRYTLYALDDYTPHGFDHVLYPRDVGIEHFFDRSVWPLFRGGR